MNNGTDWVFEVGNRLEDTSSQICIDVDNTALEHYMSYEHLLKQLNYGTAHKIYDINRWAKPTPILNRDIGILSYWNLLFKWERVP